jgi:hypothetical protein
MAAGVIQGDVHTGGLTVTTVRDFQVGDLFRSNHGRGPLLAVIKFVEGDDVHMVRWNEKADRPKRVAFKIGSRFLRSPRCGWQPIT